MLYLLLSVFFTTTVFLIIKEFNRFGVDNFQGIVVSYFVALTIGVFFSDVKPTYTFLMHSNWWFGALVISAIFISVFNIMAITAQKGGLSVMTVANKMSVVIPILAGILLYKEPLNVLKIAGILLALLGVFFTSLKKGISTFSNQLWYLPFLIFIGSGVADAVINHMQRCYVSLQEFDVFTTSLFLFCGIIGVFICVVKLALGKLLITTKSIVGGLVLGVPNYFSIYFLLKALSQPEYQTSFVFSVNNVSIVLCSVCLGVVFYKEKLSNYNYIGVVVSLLAIVLLYFAV